MKKLITILFLLSSFSLFALTLKEARSKGWVEELPTGFIKATNPGAEDLVSEINTKRKNAYLKISKKTGSSVDMVAKKAHQKIKAKLNK
ncbi:MAG: DUF1318 domain-containing protein [Bacteriovoracaceae bacterium]|nr:DUF1318 domain-containing protein [Bacteriovoracaceae bacterium]